MGDRLVMLGGGPAGLSAGYVLSKARRPAVVIEATSKLGGISRTEQYKGYRFDLGGHRFFTKFDEVQRLWEEVLGPDLLVRPRMSRIYYRGKFFDYPLKASNALQNLGPLEAARCVMSYGAARLAGGARDAVTFEQWVTSRFGKRLFEIFFKTYTEKVWGIPCSEIAAAWAAQRIKNLSLGKAAWNALFPSREVIASLIERFHYPRLGPGMMYERMGERIASWGGEVLKDQKVVAVRRDGFRVTAVKTRGPDGEQEIPGTAFISSIPLPELVRIMDPPPPDDVMAAADALRFRYMV
ncbi:MAG: FAD-dependent oxidoreductase, partial [Verrucomicrobia bacterium]|nr:FAD-dependent oxidoreductase [Verrucomicrobiota bacterium]